MSTTAWGRAPLAALAVALACGLGAGACSATATNSAPGSGAATSGTGYVVGDGTVTVIAAAHRKAAPKLAGKTLEGKPLDVIDSGRLDQVVVLNVWGSWCPPCRAEAPALQRAYERLRTKPPAGVDRVDFVGIDTRDDDPSPALAFQRSHDISYPSLYDPKGLLLLGFVGSLPPTAIPSTLVIDRHSKVAARIIGPISATTLVDVVHQVGAS